MGPCVSFSSWKGSFSSCDPTAGALSLMLGWMPAAGTALGRSPREVLSLLSSPSLDLRQGSSVAVFLDVVFRRWDGNSDVLWWKYQLVWMRVFGNWWVVSPLPKICTLWTLTGVLLSSPTVNRYICSSLFRFLLQFVIRKLISLPSLFSKFSH